jgi:hypothetical protein
MSWDALAKRIRLEQGRDLHDPGGQDGYNCLLIAAMHQLAENGLSSRLVPGFNIHQLRRMCREWLKVNRTLLFGEACLCEFGDDYNSFIDDEFAWGNHVVIFAILGVFGGLFDCCFSAKVCMLQRVCVCGLALGGVGCVALCPGKHFVLCGLRRGF